MRENNNAGLEVSTAITACVQNDLSRYKAREILVVYVKPDRDLGPVDIGSIKIEENITTRGN